MLRQADTFLGTKDGENDGNTPTDGLGFVEDSLGTTAMGISIRRIYSDQRGEG